MSSKSQYAVQNQKSAEIVLKLALSLVIIIPLLFYGKYGESFLHE